MVVADTSVWIEFLKGHEPYHSRLAVLLEERRVMGVECVFGELLQGARNRRERDIIRGYWQNLPQADEAGLWIEAGEYVGTHKLTDRGVGLIDAFILTAAVRNGGQVWTLDKRFLRIIPAGNVFI